MGARGGGQALQFVVVLELVVLVLCMVTAAAAASVELCNAEFNDLTPCINYVQGSDPAPTTTCCTAFSNVQATSPICLCQLLQQFQNPDSGLGNETRALDISTLCKVPTDVSRCSSLLGAPTPAPAMALPPPPVLAPPPLPSVSPAPTGAEVDCSAAFNNLTPCLTYVTANGTQPPASDCCTALSGVQHSQPVCLCQLLAQMNDSSQYGVNATKAMGLPAICKVHADTSKCPALLQSPIQTPPVASPTPGSSMAPAPAWRPVGAPSPSKKTRPASPATSPGSRHTPAASHAPAPSSSSSSPSPKAGTAASGARPIPASAPESSSPSSTLKGGASSQFRQAISQPAMLLLTAAAAKFLALEADFLG